MALVLGVAFGPRATTAEVRDAATGALVASGRARHQDLGPEVDDPTAWWRSLLSAVAATGEREIAAISVAGGHPGLVLLDGAGAVLRPMVPWSDAHTARDAAHLRKALGAPRWAHEAGALPGPGTAITRLAWLRRAEPATADRIGAALLPHDWLTYRLAGRPVTDRGSASLTGAWSPRSGRWITEVIATVAPADQVGVWLDRLPEVLGPSERADWLTAPLFEHLGLRGRPLVGPGTGEPMAVALALGLGPGQAAISLAGATNVLAAVERPLSDPTGAVQSRADATGRHLAVTSAAGGAGLITELAVLLDLDPAALAELALTVEPSPGGVVVVPGVPGRPGAVVAGLVPGTGRASLARAAFDGVAASALDALDRVADAGAELLDEPIRLAAPIPTVATHARTLATLAGRPVIAAPDVSLAAAGACVQAAAVLDGADPTEVAGGWRLGDGLLVEPDDDPHRVERRLALTEEHARQRRALVDRGEGG